MSVRLSIRPKSSIRFSATGFPAVPRPFIFCGAVRRRLDDFT
jgi:hypothetical protein